MHKTFFLNYIPESLSLLARSYCTSNLAARLCQGRKWCKIHGTRLTHVGADRTKGEVGVANPTDGQRWGEAPLASLNWFVSLLWATGLEWNKNHQILSIRRLPFIVNPVGYKVRFLVCLAGLHCYCPLNTSHSTLDWLFFSWKEAPASFSTFCTFGLSSVQCWKSCYFPLLLLCCSCDRVWQLAMQLTIGTIICTMCNSV